MVGGTWLALLRGAALAHAVLSWGQVHSGVDEFESLTENHPLVVTSCAFVLPLARQCKKRFQC